MWHFAHVFWLSVFALAAAIETLAADGPGLESRILQHRLDRLYFDRGVESLVSRDVRFAVYRDSVPVYFGCIEAAGPAVSYSYPTDQFFDTLDVSTLTVFLEQLERDTAGTIVLGFLKSRTLLPWHIDTVGESHNRVFLRPYASQFEMVLDLEAGGIDGFLSHRRPARSSREVATVRSAAPYVVALIPNPGRAVNERGFVTTSMYYRYDPRRAFLLFDGDAVRPFDCVASSQEDCRREYPYDPARGRRLLQHLRPRPRTLTIGRSHPDLATAVAYFADIISQDRVRVSLVEAGHEADVYVAAIPFDSADPTSSLDYIYRLLAQDTVSGRPLNEAIAIVGDYLSAARLTSEAAVHQRYHRLAESGLRDDVGVFVLIRPTVFLTYARTLVNVTFDEQGRLDLAKLVKVKLPRPDKECIP